MIVCVDPAPGTRFVESQYQHHLILRGFFLFLSLSLALEGFVTWCRREIYSYGVLGSKKLCTWCAKCSEGIKSEHVHVFESLANVHTDVIVLGRTTSRDVWEV